MGETYRHKDANDAVRKERVVRRTTINNATTGVPQEGSLGESNPHIGIYTMGLTLHVELAQSNIQPLAITGLSFKVGLIHAIKQC